MKYCKSVLDVVGNTPLVKLNKITLGLKSIVLAKLEYLNPGGSVKDRIGVAMINDAERRGVLKPGGTIIEPTSGNTGVGIVIASVIRGYKTIFTVPDKVSKEKIDLLRAYGAEVVVCQTNVPRESPESYYSVADRLEREIPGAVQLNQYFNPVNPKVHEETTGPEIWRETPAPVDYFVAGMGTGGTICGVARFLKKQKSDVKIIGVDPEGSIYSNPQNIHQYKVEGIGEDFYPKTIDLSLVDEIIKVSDKNSFEMTRRLAREEAILTGGSGGAAVWAALEVAKRLKRRAVLVVLIPDSGRGYLSKIYSDDWMRENGFL